MRDGSMRASVVSYPKEALLRAVLAIAEEREKSVPEGIAFDLERPRHGGQVAERASSSLGP